ncbi:unnamed protein product [Arabis nemorensis]|uniref:DUF7086 domain-containing protein n=1 Tax=Arabis nemorensis TaxID=586526 RepID=A0A565BTE1_9BRAS|nr:unnamed protein product [Arabis nemorensis]
MRERAPAIWTNPEPARCELCGREKAVKPVIAERKIKSEDCGDFIVHKNVYNKEPWLLDHTVDPFFQKNEWYYFVTRTQVSEKKIGCGKKAKWKIFGRSAALRFSSGGLAPSTSEELEGVFNGCSVMGIWTWSSTTLRTGYLLSSEDLVDSMTSSFSGYRGFSFTSPCPFWALDCCITGIGFLIICKYFWIKLEGVAFLRICPDLSFSLSLLVGGVSTTIVFVDSLAMCHSSVSERSLALWLIVVSSKLFSQITGDDNGGIDRGKWKANATTDIKDKKTGKTIGVKQTLTYTRSNNNKKQRVEMLLVFLPRRSSHPEINKSKNQEASSSAPLVSLGHESSLPIGSGEEAKEEKGRDWIKYMDAPVEEGQLEPTLHANVKKVAFPFRKCFGNARKYDGNAFPKYPDLEMFWKRVSTVENAAGNVFPN